ncbi:hypothetical protein Mal64_13940 [Pseudobythopirellula maris]|uniref:Uncharacterized protein n=1 Tax=Pseudobythopirellula maris TaxID=2527991 RepID=A0A5C5ZV51_9BACT|nr:hypothetical protein [Pseudobythopirellula maris]TWT90995.1 hypothetical protein Mal64_13940 [Pseudobythopirellula maris]
MNEDTKQIHSVRAQTLSQLVAIRAEQKPTYWVDGQRVHWEQYADALQRTVDWCDRKLSEYEPFEIKSQGTS